MQRIAVLLLVVMAAVVAAAQPPADSPATEIRKVLDQQQAAWNRGDLEGYMAGYWKSPELTFFSGGTVTKGWQPTLERYKARYQSEGREMGRLEFSDVDIQLLSPDVALVRGHWRLMMNSGNNPNGLFTTVWRKFPEGWRIVHDHSSAE